MSAPAAALLDRLAPPVDARRALVQGRPGVLVAVRAGEGGRPPGVVSAWFAGPVDLAAAEEAAATDDPVGLLARLVPGGERTIYALAAARRGLRFLPDLGHLAPAMPRPPPPRVAAALAAFRFRTADGEPLLVVAPPSRRLLDRLDALAGQGGVAVTTPRLLEARLQDLAAGRWMAAAAGRLARAAPDLSARDRPGIAGRVAIVAGVAAPPAILALDPDLLLALAHVVSAVSFAALAYLRLLACSGAAARIPPPPLADARLPGYTVLVALYREAAMVPGLVAALDRLDYPRDRFEVRFLLEAEDLETIAAVERSIAGRPCFRRAVCPPGAPRTKPRALALGLAMARGDLVTVYDAEDRPHPGQLRAAAAAFVAGPRHLACVQARLEVDRIRGGLQRQFALEYLVLFAGMLPWLAERGLPMPLGGTSNHFRREALEAALGWDPWNVTEDADLGLRLMRFGFAIDVVDSATREEAPARLPPWLRQRRRWIKGWMVTAVVHGGRPAALAREIGGRNAAMVVAHGLANVAAPLCHPVGLALLALHLTGLLPLPFGTSFVGDVLFAASLTGLGLGYGASVVAARRLAAACGRPDLAPATWWLPAYWLLASWAAWRALAELVVAPHRWDKTPHDPHDGGESDAWDDAGSAEVTRGERGGELERVKGIEPSS